MGEFTGRVALVTGGANGIGRAVCLAFAREGANVLCMDVDKEAGEALVQEAATRDLPGVVRFHPGDVSRAEDCQAAVERAMSLWDRLDVLVHAAGIQPAESYVPAHLLPEELWDRILDVNLKGAFLMVKYAVPEMIARNRGVIVNVASVQGLQSMKGVAAYAASKGGLLSLTRQLALEYAEHGIRVLAVNPGTIETRLAAIGVGGDLEKLRAAAAATHPLGRIGKPEEVAEVILFLASDRASFMTGEYVNVDGGLMAKGAWAD